MARPLKLDERPARSALLLVGLALASAVAGAAPREPSTDRELFRIERSTNRNIVRYDAVLTKGGALVRDRPVVAYWVLLAEDGRRDGLTWLELQLAYGFSVAPARDGFRMTLVAFGERSLTIRKSEGRWRAEVPIASRPAVLRKIWVQAEGTFLGPHVRWVELHGVDVRTGEPLVERISKGAS